MKLAFEIMKESQSLNKDKKVGEYLVFETDSDIQKELFNLMNYLEQKNYKEEEMLQLGADFEQYNLVTI